MNKWGHLPNAKHINRVLAHAQAYPEKWDASRGAAWVAARNAARNAAWNAAWDSAWDAAWNARDAARGAIVALIAYDDCAHMLEFTPEQIHLYVCLGVPAAILLEPAVRAMYDKNRYCNQRLTVS